MGLSPQLTLEAAILREGGFARYPGRLLRWRTDLRQAQRQQSAGRAADPGTEDQANDTPQPPDKAADEARNKLAALIRAFEDEDQAYTSLDLLDVGEPLRHL